MHRCGLLPQMSHVARSVCVCVSVYVLGTHVSWAKTDEPIEMPFRRLIPVCKRNRVLDGVQRRGTFEGDMYLLIVMYLWMSGFECIALCSPAAAGECACPAHAAYECICRRERRQDSDEAFCQITLDTCYCFGPPAIEAEKIIYGCNGA